MRVALAHAYCPFSSLVVKKFYLCFLEKALDETFRTPTFVVGADILVAVAIHGSKKCAVSRRMRYELLGVRGNQPRFVLLSSDPTLVECVACVTIFAPCSCWGAHRAELG